ncbi:hypothetical protein [Muricoccus nepalensis]|uniref:hypothetical protein n=1 Tax=Muricoccus nepalensis TaxID=1854500 RepID=UPI00112EE2C8|nr:hypothetical protein [Roseomonas nepalensis]
MRERAMPFRPDAGRYVEARDPGPARQARPGRGLARVLLASALLGGCVGSPGESPREFYRQISGEALESRPLPPGMDRPSPNLATVPQRPSRGPSSARADLSASLAANRAAAATPLTPGAPVPDRPATEGLAAVPAAPPAPARLAPAPRIGTGPATLLVPGTAAPVIEEAAPEGPSPALTAPAAPDLAAPPSFPSIAPRGR